MRDVIKVKLSILYLFIYLFIIFACSYKRHMEERTESPMAVKVEKDSQSIILTYFHGDTNSMVDAHFSRALGTVSKDKGLAKTKKTRKSIKSGNKMPRYRRQMGLPIQFIQLSVSVHRKIHRQARVHHRRLPQAPAFHRRPPDFKPYR